MKPITHAALASTFLLLSLPSMAQITTTHTYKTAGDLQIKLDCIRPDNKDTLPVIVWIHGGALINGGRQSVSRRLRQPLLDAGFAIVSIDYRLAPETKLPQIIEDLEDAFTWINTQGPSKLNIDPQRVGVMGSSAGGYLTLTAGFRARPRPKALVAFWGYGDLIGPWYSQPSPHPRHNRRPITEKEARAQVDPSKPIANAQDRNGNGGLFYVYTRQQGTWPSEVSNWNPHTQPEKYNPYMPVKNVDKNYPPTLLIHGDQDTDVPHKQSEMMAAQFTKNKTPHEFISVLNAEHGLGGGNPQVIQK
ncbi:MAG: alpha/beta hydrolase, partial [Planctomycetota bacterium]